MTTPYPESFPCASRIEGHSAAISAGLVQTPMEAGNTRQRRAHRVLPHRIELVFVIDQAIYAGWLAWVNAHAWDEWVAMKLPGLEASRAGVGAVNVPVRFCSDLQEELIPVHRLWYWRVRVACEYLPPPAQLQEGGWIIAGRPGQAATDWILAGTPSTPSADTINPGTPAAPAVFV